MVEKQRFKIINGCQLTGSVPNQDDLYFWGFSDCDFSENQYLEELTYLQSTYARIKKGHLEICDRWLNRINNRSLQTLVTGELAHFCRFEDQEKDVIPCIRLEVVKVFSTADGFKFYGGVGRHLFYVAQHYDLDLLVYIMDTPPHIYDNNEAKSNSYSLLGRVLSYIEFCLKEHLSTH